MHMRIWTPSLGYVSGNETPAKRFYNELHCKEIILKKGFHQVLI